MALLPDMEPFRLGRPLNVGGGVNNIGSVEDSNGDPHPERASFTPSEEEGDSDDFDDI